jgi:phage baseplate assembly protein V
VVISREDIVRVVKQAVAPLDRRVRNMIGRAVIKRTNSDRKMQDAQVGLLAGEVRDGVEHFEAYGFTSRPHPGAEGVFLSITGNRDHGALVCVGDRRYRLKALADGEVAMYTDEGTQIVLKKGGDVQIVPSGAGLVNLGAAVAADFVAHAAKCDANFTALAAGLAAHTHLVGPSAALTGAGDVPTGVGVPTPPVVPVPVGATKVKAT